MELEPEYLDSAKSFDKFASKKQSAFQFLRELNSALDADLPAPAVMRREISRIVAEAHQRAGEEHKKHAESALVNEFIIPKVFDVVAAHIGKDAARKSLLSEYKRMRSYSANSPLRTVPHPFSKRMGEKPQSILTKWKTAYPFTQSAPDIAIADPFEFKIVFEAKYFPKGGIEYAGNELVRNIYQAFFYLGLPPLPPSERRPAYVYEYSCLIAYDASESGSLKTVWDKLPKKTKKGFWEGGNIYIMILRGNTNLS